MKYGREQPRKQPDLSSTYSKQADSPLSAGYGMSEQEFRRWYPGPTRNMSAGWYGGSLVQDSAQRNWQNRLADAVLMHNKESRARNEAGWDAYNARIAAENDPALYPKNKVEEAPIAPSASAGEQTWSTTAKTGVGGLPRGDKFYTNSLRDLMTDPRSFERTPGFKAALDTGRQAIERSFAAKGMGNSGNVLAELMKYGTGLASQEYGGQVDRLSRLSQYEQGNPDYWNRTRWGRA